MRYSDTPPAAQQRTNRLSVIAFVLALLQIFGPVAAVCGHVSLGQIKRFDQKGHTLALVAIIAGWIQTALIVVFVVSPETVGFVFGYLFGLVLP
jgi:hypothetical protein